MAFWVALKGGKSGRRLYLFFYLFFFLFGTLVGNVSSFCSIILLALPVDTDYSKYLPSLRTLSSSPAPLSSPISHGSQVSPRLAPGSLLSSRHVTSPPPFSSLRTRPTWCLRVPITSRFSSTLHGSSSQSSRQPSSSTHCYSSGPSTMWNSSRETWNHLMWIRKRR